MKVPQSHTYRFIDPSIAFDDNGHLPKRVLGTISREDTLVGMHCEGVRCASKAKLDVLVVYVVGVWKDCGMMEG